MSGGFLILADGLKSLREEKKTLDARIKVVNSQIGEAEAQLIKEMVDNEMSRFDRNGDMFSLKIATYGSPLPSKKKDLYEALKKMGYNDLFTVNSSTLSGFIKEQTEANDGILPEWLADKVSVYEKTSIQIRKGGI